MNTRSLSRVDSDRHAKHIAANRKLSNRRWERISKGEMSWCGTLFPTNGHAQEAEMSLAEYEDFVFAACHVHEEDAASHWRAASSGLGARAAELGGVRELRIVGPDSDLRLGVDGRSWLAADGHNMPDGEVFTSPIETETEGEIRYTFPAVYHGREVEDIRLRFEEGRVVHAEASRGDDYLQSLLDMDPGARVLGEVAFGLNYEIDRFTRILFDEKIGGTMHLALGSGFQQTEGQNTSGLHWDMICDLREDGEVYADGELIWKNGHFLAEPPSRSSRAPSVADDRLERLAGVLVDYSTGVKEGDLVCIDTTLAAAPLVQAIWRRVLAAGAHPHLRVDLDAAQEILLREGNEAQIDWITPLRRAEVERADVRIAVEAESQHAGEHDRRPRTMARAERAREPLRRIHFRRAQRGRGSAPSSPSSPRTAPPRANMSLGEYEDFVFRAGLLDHATPSRTGWHSEPGSRSWGRGWEGGRRSAS